MQIRQHIPSWASDPRDPPLPIYTFHTLEEMLQIPFVAKWAEHPTFVRFSLSSEMLMVELNESYTWWVVGHIAGITDGIINALPIWKAKNRIEG